MPKRAEHGFWVHDGLFWDTGCTCNLLQGHTCAQGRRVWATLHDLQRSFQCGAGRRHPPLQQHSVRLQSQGWLLRRRKRATRRTRPAPSPGRESFVAAGSSTQLRRCPNRPIRDQGASRRRRGSALPRDGRTKRQSHSKEAAQQKWPPAAPRTRRPIRNPSFLIQGPCPRPLLR